MILCCCTGSSERELRTLVREGARDLWSLGQASGAGACCGGCRPLLRELLKEEGVESASGSGGAAGRLEVRSANDREDLLERAACPDPAQRRACVPPRVES